MSARQVRTAAKYYTCNALFAHHRMIAPGDKYVRITIFPTDNPRSLKGRPIQAVYCLPCGEAGLI
jgi:hypothetical protein